MQQEKRMYVCTASAGTGKTYTLAAHYIALLMNDVPSKNILAVTFTNKATAEMKQRIITYLNAIANYGHLDDTRTFLDKVIEVSQTRLLHTFTPDEYAIRAKDLLQRNMSNFDDLCISTIDSFLQTLLTGLAQALGQAAGFGIDLDIKHAITTAVDEVLSMDVSENEDIRSAVQKCLNERFSIEDKWDLRPSLIKLAEQLFKENVQQIRENIPLASTFDSSERELIEQYNKSLKRFTNQDAYLAFKTALDKIRHLANPLSQQTGGRNYASFFRKCESLYALSNPEMATLNDTDFNRFQHPEKLPTMSIDDLELLQTQVGIINEKVPLFYPDMVRWKVCKEYLNELMLVGYVIDRIKRDQRENNTFLLCETAHTLIQALDKHDAQFILMKAGIRFKHIMLDEFQDTSSLQWQNFRLLLEEIVATIDGSVLIVGDVKQSIYRWRNGDYEIMNNLHKPQPQSNLHIYYNQQRLACNRRSRQEIVEFNLRTFHQLATSQSDSIPELAEMYDEQFELHPITYFYDANKTGGYVCLRQFTGGSSSDENELAKEQLLTFMFQQMEDLLQHGYRKKDMLILTRTAAEAKRVLKTFNHLRQDVSLYPKLNQAGKIISNDSFHLESSIAVNTIICALQMLLHQDQIAQTYIATNHPTINMDALKSLSVSLPLTDLVEQIIHITLCPDGTYLGQDLAFLNCLRDKIRGYISKYGSNLSDFLQYWADKMHTESIPAAQSDDIRIMTIHSSKGLQAKNIFIPFCAWKEEVDASKKETLWCEMADLKHMNPQKDYLPVSYGSNMTQVDELKDIHDQEQKKQYIDALNLLYVACTRAEDNLFILINKNNYTGKTVGQWLTKIYGEKQDFGTIQYPIQKQASEKIPEPFSFEHATDIPAQYHCSSVNIQFRQSHLTQQMMRQNQALDDNADNIAFGNLCHAILEQVQTQQDVERIVNDFYLQGAIPTEKNKQQITGMLNRLMQHPIAGEWFNGQWKLLREDTVLYYPNPQQDIVQECRMDRVMIHNDQVIVLDYKFGKMQDTYLEQVQNYMQTMRQMGYSSVRGYLWYGFQGKLVEVNL